MQYIVVQKILTTKYNLTIERGEIKMSLKNEANIKRYIDHYLKDEKMSVVVQPLRMQIHLAK